MNMNARTTPAAEVGQPHVGLVSDIARLYAERTANGRASMDDAGRLFADIACRLDTLALLDQAAAGGGARPNAINITAYLGDVGRLVIASLAAENRMALDLSSPAECLISARHAALLGQIAVDMVSNAVLYAHPAGVPGRIRIGCEREPDGALVMQVCDDGVGLPEGMDPASDVGVGFQSMRSLCRELGGDLTFHSSCLGLHCQVRLPSLRLA